MEKRPSSAPRSGPLGLQEPLLFPLGIPTCWGERLCWEAATPSTTEAISTT